MNKCYLDNGSTSFPKAPGVGAAMQEYIENIGCNINRGGYESAYDFADMVYETRCLLGKLFNFSKESNICFTPSVTYALNFVITGLLKEGDHAITSSMEHNAVARPLQCLKDSGIIELTHLPCDREGFLKPDDLAANIQDNTRLVIISAASNVSGTLQDIEAISRICRDRDVFLVLDAAQAAGVIDIDFSKLGLSGLCVPGHKGLLGPQGVGVLLVTDQLADAISPVIHGGTGSVSDSLTMPDFLPDKFEAGTLNLPGIVGLKKAVEFVISEGPEKILQHELSLVSRFIDGIKALDSVRIAGTTDLTRRVGVVSLDFPDNDNAEVSFRLDSEFGVMTRCGLHCAPLAHKSLDTYPAGTVRFSFGYFNTDEDVDYALDCVNQILNS